MPEFDLSGLRVLVVEDEPLIAMDLAHSLVAAGLIVVGPLLTLDEALGAAAEVEADIALLDVSLGGKPVWPVAQILAVRGMPIVLITAHLTLDLPGSFALLPKLGKPTSVSTMLDVIAEVLHSRRS